MAWTICHIYINIYDYSTQGVRLCLEKERCSLMQAVTPLEVLEKIFALPDKDKLMSIFLIWRRWSERNKIRHAFP